MGDELKPIKKQIKTSYIHYDKLFREQVFDRPFLKVVK